MLSLGSITASVIVISIALGAGVWGMFGARYRYIGVSVAREVSAVVAGGIAPLVGAGIIAWTISLHGGAKEAGVLA